MAKCLLLWEVDTTHTPTDKEERKKMHLGMQSIVTQQCQARPSGSHQALAQPLYGATKAEGYLRN